MRSWWVAELMASSPNHLPPGEMADEPDPIDWYAGTQKRFPWIFKIKKDYRFSSIHRGKSFDSRWLRLEPDGTVTVKANKRGYAWDGCTPKFSILGLLIIGTPDGHIDIETGKPITYHASLVHDAFYQYLRDVPVSRREIDRQFLLTLRQHHFPLAWLYYAAVRIFGGRGIKQLKV